MWIWDKIKGAFGWIGSLFTPQNLQQEVKDVQNATVVCCQFLPAATVVAEILTAANPTVTTVSGIAAAICAAVTKSSTMNTLVAEPPTVNGVVIEGEFVK